jgi:hypothetical protein
MHEAKHCNFAHYTHAIQKHSAQYTHQQDTNMRSVPTTCNITVRAESIKH